jgi:hypothetical protein
MDENLYRFIMEKSTCRGNADRFSSGKGHTVLSFVENTHREGCEADKTIPFEEWIKDEKTFWYRHDKNPNKNLCGQKRVRRTF